jgi:hypothetical protein
MVSRHIENKYYGDKNEHLRYPIERSRSAHISGIRIPNASKELYSKLSFVVYQMKLLVNVKENIKPENSFGKYF